MKPPTGGPRMGANSVGMPSQAMADTISALGMARSRISRPTGSIIAPPRPWQKRPATRLGRFQASAQPMDDSVNTPMAAANTVLAPKRSAHQPLIGMKIASATK